MKKKVSVVVLNWNGKQNLATCLSSLRKASYRPLEVVVVDNNSHDGSQQFVRQTFPWVKLVENRKNLGYAGGNNKGIQASSGEYVFVLNNDTEVEKNFLEPLVEAMENNPKIGCAQPKIVYGSDHKLLNAVGSYLTSTGFLYHYGYRKNADLPQYNKILKIFSAKGAALLFRKKALDKVGMFDEDFFIFFEETDLCHRLWLAGYQVIYIPSSVVYHYEAIDTKQMSRFSTQYLSFRNRICSYMKNLETMHAIELLIILLPVYLFLLFFYLFTFQFDLVVAIVGGVIWNIVHFSTIMRKRKKIQGKIRVLRDVDFFPFVKKDPSPIYYYYLFTTLKNFKNEKPF